MYNFLLEDDKIDNLRGNQLPAALWFFHLN